MKVSITPDAQRDLHGIWLWNAEQYDVPHAHLYLSFLREHTLGLADSYPLAKPVANRTGYYSMLIRKGSGYGHIAVFQIVEDTIEVLRYFHTSQDWERQIEGSASQ